ncbi:hypothetical protein SAMN05216456_0353 [Devosia crocina]|uniref:N-acetyltransferase domain-containing protein n=1 Tax=Devosia crocina TaxID=429728 RepID=A0A1I7MZC4_9HYPH|nr:hypothetical protein [Devosia crocina]SFV27752.1 hypothetical protein SAMN05216456_0353 [Devosia crocina]
MASAALKLDNSEIFQRDGALETGAARSPAVSVSPISGDDLEAVGLFLHQNLNGRIAARSWAEMIVPSWQAEHPNHGFMLRQGTDIVGVQLAFYSLRASQDGPLRFCNIAAFCVLPEYRIHSLRLLKAILAQPGYIFTDLSPSGNVRPINLRLGFQMLDTATALVPNPAWLLVPASGRLVTDPAEIAIHLTGADLRIFNDHLSAQAVRHALLLLGDRYCYVVYRRDRRKNLPLFATLLYVSDPALFERCRSQLFRHLFVRHGIVFTLMEMRLVRTRPRLSRLLPGHRPKMFRSDDAEPAAIDYLYSELTCVAW